MDEPGRLVVSHICDGDHPTLGWVIERLFQSGQVGLVNFSVGAPGGLFHLDAHPHAGEVLEKAHRFHQRPLPP